MDWLETRLPQVVQFRPIVEEEIASYRYGERSQFKPSPEYAAVVDLRKNVGIDALLHVGRKRGNGGHKIQLVGSGRYSFGQHMATLESIVDTDPLQLQPMRTDLTVDVRDVPMSAVLTSARVEHKRFVNRMGRVNSAPDDASMTPDEREQFSLIGCRDDQSYYVGMRPNCYRVYNKTAERKAAYGKEFRGWNPPEPKFNAWLRSLLADKRQTGKAFVQFEAICYRLGLDPRIELEASASLRLATVGDMAQISVEQMRERLGLAPSSEALVPELRLFANLRMAFEMLHDVWVRKVEKQAEKPTFEEYCGLTPNGVLTRFERQIGAQQVGTIHLVGDPRRVPIFSTLKEMRANLPDYNPFASVSFERGQVDPPRGNMSLTEYYAAMYFRSECMKWGRQVAEKAVRDGSNGHGAKLLKEWARFIPAGELDGGAEFTGAQLFEMYHEAIGKQLAA